MSATLSDALLSPSWNKLLKRKQDPSTDVTIDPSRKRVSALGLTGKQLSKAEKQSLAAQKKKDAEAKTKRKVDEEKAKDSPADKKQKGPLSKLERMHLADKRRTSVQEKREEKVAKAAMPKKAKSAYVCFSVAERQAVVAANPEAEPKDIMKLLGEAWKELSEDDKQKWDAEAAKDKERYLEECKEAGINPDKDCKDEDKGPRKNKSAYALFTLSERARVSEENPDEDSKAVTKLLLEAWKELSEENKKQWEGQAEEDKKRYVEECEVAGVEPEVTKPKAKEGSKEGSKNGSGKKTDDDPAKPKGPKSAYLIFSSNWHQRNGDMKAKLDEKAKLISAEWKALDEATKKEWEAKAGADRARYEEECAAAGIEVKGEKAGKENKNKKAKAPKANVAEESAEADEAVEADVKKPKSAYLLFCDAERANVKAADPQLKAKEVLSKLGEAWKALGKDEKSAFEEKAKADKERFAAECAAAGIEAGGSGGADKEKEEEIKRRLEEANAEEAAASQMATDIKQPKPHKEAIFFYKKAKRVEVAMANPELPTDEVVELLQQHFDKLSPAEAAPFEEEAAKDLKRYQEACDAHKVKKDELAKVTRTAKAKVAAITKELKDERARLREANKAKAEANKAAKAEKEAAKADKAAEKATKVQAKAERAEKAAAKKAAKAGEAAEEAMETEKQSEAEPTGQPMQVEEAAEDEEDEETEANKEEDDEDDECQSGDEDDE